ncbi:arylamine N-acetyltransferase family protein [Bacillus marasmi]|uniref:arylamine N-acetyltransferase family protein n=1 Tax=Bacillus marasmi TaxID=1926279 RepID=UPI0011C7C925|nr:arylamine N-acetyltransferase [Bacillus marasmi]
MSNINKLFRLRIGFPEDQFISFDSLDILLEKTAKSIPFENLAILSKSYKVISKQYLSEKILSNNEGGVCYEINTMLYHFLMENGFDVKLIRGRTYIHAAQTWSPTGRTHVVVLLTHDGKNYVVDSGFGLNLPLKPVPLSGEVVTSETGEFRICWVKSEDGDYLMEIKLKGRDTEWGSGYIFDTKHPIVGETVLNEVQQIIVESPLSPFNKAPLLTKVTDRGNIVLTETAFTERIDGKEHKREIDHVQFQQLKKQYFNM